MVPLMSIPDYGRLADALMALIYFRGGPNHVVTPNETYRPLADFFSLTAEERTRKRADGHPGRDWENKVQWTRQRLINLGLMWMPGRGLWALSAAGIGRAATVAASHELLDGSRGGNYD
jgi:hypothetical protein